jgi:ATP-dependent Clp protease ATP-binding subunit ClpA
VFEEFEKLGDPVKEALLHPFESGEWSIKKPGKAAYADCSNIIFLITSNWKNQEILNWIEENKALQQYVSASKNFTRNFL